MGGKVVKVHSIESKEMPMYDPPRAVERYVRAVRERNVRLCYVRLFLTGAPDPMTANLSYLDALRGDLRGGGFALGRPSPIAAPNLSPILLLGLGCGSFD